MQLELKDDKGLIGTIELPLEQLKEALDLGSASTESEAHLKESQGKVAELGEKLAKAESRTMANFTPTEKAQFIIPWMRELSSEDFVRLATETGHDAQLVPATDAEVAEAEAKQKAEAEVEEAPKTIPGKTDKPGYRYLEHLDLSVKE